MEKVMTKDVINRLGLDRAVFTQAIKMINDFPKSINVPKRGSPLYFWWEEVEEWAKGKNVRKIMMEGLKAYRLLIDPDYIKTKVEKLVVPEEIRELHYMRLSFATSCQGAQIERISTKYKNSHYPLHRKSK